MFDRTEHRFTDKHVRTHGRSLWLPVLRPGMIRRSGDGWIILVQRRDNGWMVRWEGDRTNTLEWMSDSTIEST